MNTDIINSVCVVSFHVSSNYRAKRTTIESNYSSPLRLTTSTINNEEGERGKEKEKAIPNLRHYFSVYNI